MSKNPVSKNYSKYKKKEHLKLSLNVKIKKRRILVKKKYHMLTKFLNLTYNLILSISNKKNLTLIKKDLILIYMYVNLMSKSQLKLKYIKKLLLNVVRKIYKLNEIPLFDFYSNIHIIISNELYKKKFLIIVKYLTNLCFKIYKKKKTTTLSKLNYYKFFNIISYENKMNYLSKSELSDVFFSLKQKNRLLSQKLLYLPTDYLNISKYQLSGTSNLLVNKLDVLELNKIYNQLDGSHEIGFIKFKKRFKIIQILLNNKLFNNILIDNYKSKKKIKKKYLWKPFNMLWLWIFKDPIVEKVINYMVVRV